LFLTDGLGTGSSVNTSITNGSITLLDGTTTPNPTSNELSYSTITLTDADGVECQMTASAVILTDSSNNRVGTFSNSQLNFTDNDGGGINFNGTTQIATFKNATIPTASLTLSADPSFVAGIENFTANPPLQISQFTSQISSGSFSSQLYAQQSTGGPLYQSIAQIIQDGDQINNTFAVEPTLQLYRYDSGNISIYTKQTDYKVGGIYYTDTLYPVSPGFTISTGTPGSVGGDLKLNPSTALIVTTGTYTTIDSTQINFNSTGTINFNKQLVLPNTPSTASFNSGTGVLTCNFLSNSTGIFNATLTANMTGVSFSFGRIGGQYVIYVTVSSGGPFTISNSLTTGSTTPRTNYTSAVSVSTSTSALLTITVDTATPSLRYLVACSAFN